MRYGYICSPYQGKEYNYNRAILAARRIIKEYPDVIPIVPHVMMHHILDDSNPEDRVKGLKISEDLLIELHDAAHDVTLFICGKEITSGMKAEIELSKSRGIPIVEKQNIFD